MFYKINVTLQSDMLLIIKLQHTGYKIEQINIEIKIKPTSVAAGSKRM